MSSKISLLNYITGGLDVEKIRTENGLSSSLRVRKSKGVKKPPHPSVAKGEANANEKTAATFATGPVNSNFTAKEDARILEWKAANEGKPWKSLADELGKHQGAVKERFKELKAGTGEAGPTAGGNGKDKEKSKGGNLDGNIDKQKKGGGQGETKARGGKAGFDADESEMVRFLLKEDEEDKWLRIASRLFDKTGRAVHAEELREKFGKK